MSTSNPVDYLALIRSGLPPTSSPRRKVIVIGAGMAGLTAAYELQRAGHEPIVLEGQHRVGGRVCTLREPFSDGLYAETGAMRIPRAHDLTMAYIDTFQRQGRAVHDGQSPTPFIICAVSASGSARPPQARRARLRVAPH